MTIKYADDRLKSEPTLAYAAFVCYRDNRDLSEAYNCFMQDNADALTSMKAFIKWAGIWDWQKRVNAYDAEQELSTKQAIRRKGVANSLTAETMAAELYTTCMEEMDLKRGDMTHNDISRYLNICQKIGERWVKQPDAPTVNVNVEQKVETNVKTEQIDPEIAAEVGRLLALKESVAVEEEE